MASQAPWPLPKEVMEQQLSTIDLLLAMFPSPEEMETMSSTEQTLDQLRSWCADEGSEATPQIPDIISLSINLTIEGEQTTEPRIIQMNVSVPLHSGDPNGTECPAVSYALRQPSWLSKAQLAQLSADMPPDDIFEAFEYVRDSAPSLEANDKAQPTSTNPSSKAAAAAAAASSTTTTLVRVWFYFPSLSTRAKRNDLVNHAPRYNLTGFVLAGKPGVLCLEGVSEDVDRYMKFIKTDSWGDIPSHQKKVSERFREADVPRVFEGMQEITDSLGERHGQRGNRGDMQALEIWLRARGVGEAFEKVIF